MKTLYKGLTSILCYFILASTYAQTGIIRGTVIEDATGEPLFGVTVIIKGTTNGAVTDFDGKFDIKVEPGVHDVQASFVSFSPLTVSGLEVKAGEVTLIDVMRLQEDVQQLEEIVITAEAIKTTEEALLTVKKKSANVIDGISSASFRKIGDSDAGEAAKRVTGVSVEGGKYVFVRGLGDRYTKTTLNGMDIPGLDPDRNSIQIDIFPTALVNNLLITKSFTPDLPADFTGGLVNIETKDFPEEKILDVKAGITYIPSMHFQSDFIDYDGGNTDFLGFDDGSRNAPEVIFQPGVNTTGLPDDEARSIAEQFDPTLGASQETSPLNFDLGFTLGNQTELKNSNKLGYILSLTYRNSTTFYDDLRFGEYQLDPDPSEFEMIVIRDNIGLQSERNVLLGGLTGLAYKTDNSKYKFNIMHLQNGVRRSAQFSLFENPDAPNSSGFIGQSDNLEYNERRVTNFFLNGEHYFQEGKWNVDWRSSLTFSSQDDPDIRRAPFDITFSDSSFVFNPGGAGGPQRLWRFLDEINVVGKVDITRELEWFGEDAKVKFGASHTYKERDFEIAGIELSNVSNADGLTGDPNEIWTDQFLAPNGPLGIQTFINDPNSNEFNSVANNTGFYVMTEFTPFASLKTILGVRAENFVQRHTGRDATNTNSLDNEKVLDALDFFPSANFIYGLNDDMNLRLSYSRTIARPSFKELSFAQILDPVSGRTFNGGLFPREIPDPNNPGATIDVGGLVETSIDNVDLRWELFKKRGQLYSVSVFYKNFQDPIEIVRLQGSNTTQVQPRNVGNGRLIGVELEIRKSLDFISESLTNLSFTSNFTYVDSQIDISEEELIGREGNARDGQEIEDTRDMQGQAPYVVNAGFAYANPDKGWEAGLYYNVQGETLVIVGNAAFPDVFTVPFHSLNFNANKTFGVDDRYALNFSVSNIVNDRREQVYQNFGATDQNFLSFDPGVAIGIGFTYSFY